MHKELSSVNVLRRLKEVDYEIPKDLLIKKREICFTAGQFDENVICDESLAHLTQPLPEFYFSSVKKRRAEYLAGRLCAGDAVKRLCGLQYSPGITPSGSPTWPEGLTGSISHSGCHIISVVMRVVNNVIGIGVDLEQIISADQLEMLANTVLLPSERKRFVSSQHTEWERRVNSTLVFSLKESLFKALYPVICQPFYFDAAEVLSCSLGGAACLKIVEDLAPPFKSGFQVSGSACLYQGKVLTVIF